MSVFYKYLFVALRVHPFVLAVRKVDVRHLLSFIAKDIHTK